MRLVIRIRLLECESHQIKWKTHFSMNLEHHHARAWHLYNQRHILQVHKLVPALFLEFRNE